MKQRTALSALAFLSMASAFAGASGRKTICVNSDVTTHIVMPEQLKMVDLSTNMIIGDQCTDNMVRIKPATLDSVSGGYGYVDRQFLGTITLIGERHMSQYDVVYDCNPRNAESFYEVAYADCENYSNPEISMPEAEMANYAWAIIGSKRRFNSVRASAYGINASIYNIYSIGNFFFIDLYLKNNTNIAYEIDQMRVTLTDKKETKATNSQTLELTPVFVLNDDKSFRKDYRQILVLNRLTFPDEKILNITVTEDQISGRVITIPIEYEDILHADAFDKTKMNAYENLAAKNVALQKEIKRLHKDVRDKMVELSRANQDIRKANDEIKKLDGKLKSANNKKTAVEKKLQAMRKLNTQFKKLNESMANLNVSEEIPVTPGPVMDSSSEGVLTLTPLNTDDQ